MTPSGGTNHCTLSSKFPNAVPHIFFRKKDSGSTLIALHIFASEWAKDAAGMMAGNLIRDSHRLRGDPVALGRGEDPRSQQGVSLTGTDLSARCRPESWAQFRRLLASAHY